MESGQSSHDAVGRETQSLKRTGSCYLILTFFFDINVFCAWGFILLLLLLSCTPHTRPTVLLSDLSFPTLSDSFFHFLCISFTSSNITTSKHDTLQPAVPVDVELLCLCSAWESDGSQSTLLSLHRPHVRSLESKATVAIGPVHATIVRCMQEQLYPPGWSVCCSLSIVAIGLDIKKEASYHRSDCGPADIGFHEPLPYPSAPSPRQAAAELEQNHARPARPAFCGN